MSYIMNIVNIVNIVNIMDNKTYNKIHNINI